MSVFGTILFQAELEVWMSVFNGPERVFKTSCVFLAILLKRRQMRALQRLGPCTIEVFVQLMHALHN